VDDHVHYSIMMTAESERRNISHSQPQSASNVNSWAHLQ